MNDDHVARVLPFRNSRRGQGAPTDSGTRLRESIGGVLREERQVQERTLAEVAETSSISLAYLSEVERGRKDVSADLLIAISRSLGLDGAEVLERSAQRLRTGMQSGSSGFQMRVA